MANLAREPKDALSRPDYTTVELAAKFSLDIIYRSSIYL